MKRLPLISVLVVLAAPVAIVAIAAVAARPAARVEPGQAAGATATGSKIVTAANAFLAMLDAGERAKAAFPFDSPQKTNWSNLPSGAYQRNSLRLGDLTPPKHAAALALVSAALSAEGYRKVSDIMNGDEVLKEN